MEVIWAFPRGSVQHIAILLLAGIAFWRGAGPEKATGTILVGMLLILWVDRALFPQDGAYEEIDLSALTQDIFAMIAFGALALYANRIYPLWIAAAQVIATLMHFNREISSMIDPLAYAIVNRLPSYLQILAFMLVLAAHQRRVRRFGTYRSWRISFGRSSAKADRPSPQR